MNVIAAGLFHAAYIYGEYGTGERGMTDAKREQVRCAVGVKTEELIAGYTALKWSKQAIPTIREGLTTLGPKDREILLVRLANELEDHLDFGVLYCGNAEHRREYIRSSLYLCVGMAHRLGFPALAAALARTFQSVVSAELPTPTGTGHDHSFLLTAV